MSLSLRESAHSFDERLPDDRKKKHSIYPVFMQKYPLSAFAFFDFDADVFFVVRTSSFSSCVSHALIRFDASSLPSV
jgi:hypothetical protein